MNVTRHRYRPGLILGTVALLIATWCRPAHAGAMIGGAGTRGFFSWAAIGGFVATPGLEPANDWLHFPLRIEGLFAQRNSLTHLVLSGVTTVRVQLHTAGGGHFRPHLATGPGLHLQGTWSNLAEFGSVERRGVTVFKWHVFAGATLIQGRVADLMVESRYTAPSKLTFDYVYVGINFH